MPEFKKRKAARLKKIEEQRKFDRRASAARNRQEGKFSTHFSPTQCQPYFNYQVILSKKKNNRNVIHVILVTLFSVGYGSSLKVVLIISFPKVDYKSKVVRSEILTYVLLCQYFIL